MKKILFLVFCAIVPLGVLAQNTRLVRGVVLDEDGNPKAGVNVVEVGGTATTVTGQNGVFSMMVSPYSQSLETTADGYHPCRVDIDASYMVFRLQLQSGQKAKTKRQQEPGSTDTNVKADPREVTTQKLLSEQEKQLEQERLREEEIRREEERQHQAFLDSLMIRQQQMIEELARKKEEEERKAEFAKKQAREELDKKYNKKYRNKGLIHTFELTYAHQLASGDLVYKNLGYKTYGSLEPVGLNYLIGYRVSNWVSFNLGVGLTYDLNNLCLEDDVFDERYPEPQTYTPFNVPVFVDMNIYMSRGKVQPFLSVSGGVSVPRWQGLLDFGLGVNFRLNKRQNLYLQASIARTPYISFEEPTADTWGDHKYKYYNVLTRGVWAPSFKLGFSL